MNIYEVIKQETQPHVQQAALIEGQQRISYAELCRRIIELSLATRRTSP